MPPPGRHGSPTGYNAASERLERLLVHIVRDGAPIRAGGGGRTERALQRARRKAERLAEDAGRGDLLAEAREIVVEAYVSRLGDAGLWTSLIATTVPYSAEDRADSQAAVLDLVTAAVAEDLLDAADVRLLREDGEHLVGVPTLITDVRGTAAGGLSARTAPRERPIARRLFGSVAAALLVVVVFLVVLGATSDGLTAAVVAAVVAGLLVLSVVGPSWWERRGGPGPSA